MTGPTGSGKTTTLYAALGEINDPETNISTVEDPIEYDLPGVTQIQVNPDIGLDFARGRVGIYEVMKINSELRTMIAKQALTEEIHEAAMLHGMMELRRYASQLLLPGVISLEEVMQVVSMGE